MPPLLPALGGGTEKARSIASDGLNDGFKEVKEDVLDLGKWNMTSSLSALLCTIVKEYEIYKRLEKIRDPGIHLKEGQEYYLLGGLAIAYGRLKPF